MYDHITASPFGDKTTILHPLYNIAVYLLYASTMVLVLHIVYRRTLDPLSHIPGPLFGSITNLYLLFYTLTLRRCKTLLRLSTTYGPVLRVAPNKVIFNAPEAANAIYRDHKMHKGPAYDMFRLDGGGLHTISTTKMEDHSRVRNSYAAHYTPVNVSKYSGTIYGTINKALAAFEAKSTRDGGEGVEVDTMVLFRHLMIDIACISLFGYKHVAVDNFINGIKDEFADAIGAWPRLSLFRGILPQWAWVALGNKMPTYKLRILCQADKIVSEFARARVRELRSTKITPEPATSLISKDALGAGSGESIVETASAPSLPAMTRMLNHTPRSGPPITEDEVARESMGHMMAGSDTLSITISFTLWELSRRPKILQRLQAELDAISPSSTSTIPDDKDLKSLPYLSSVLKEGIRLYSAAPFLLERIVPSPGLTICGVSLPAGTIIGTQSYSLSRNATMFPDPELFDPERWLDDPHGRAKVMWSHTLPFGLGHCACVGQNMAMTILRAILFCVCKGFDLTPGSATTAESMDVVGAFVILPRGMKCELVFTPRTK